MREWDPIGVAGISEATDEYDAYVGKVYVMLMDERVTAEAIAAYLIDIATNYMGLSTRPELLERCVRTAAAVVLLRPDFETH
jgi:hypothetical protein